MLALSMNFQSDLVSSRLSSGSQTHVGQRSKQRARKTTGRKAPTEFRDAESRCVGVLDQIPQLIPQHPEHQGWCSQELATGEGKVF